MVKVFANNATNQSEMPFALLQGEPLTVIPQDLYIPPDALLVFLEAFFILTGDPSLINQHEH